MAEPAVRDASSAAVAGADVPPVAPWSESAAAGTAWEAAGWSERGQTMRFAAALRWLAPRPGDTLLDYGCGHGRLSEWLDDRVAYVGYDREPAMVERARHERGSPTRQFVGGGMPEGAFDLVAAIGVWNLRGASPWVELERLWARADRALVASLYRGHDRRCQSYRPEELIVFAGYVNARRWAVDATHLENDLLLVLLR